MQKGENMHVFCLYIYLPHDFTRLPIPEHYEPLSPRTKNRTTIQCINRPASGPLHGTTTSLLEILIYACFDLVFEYGVRVGITPHANDMPLPKLLFRHARAM